MAICVLALPAAVAAPSNIVVVATTSTLGAAARAVGGEDIAVETILPPGTCPSHFDLEPAQVRRVLGCTLVLRHEFQTFLDSRLLSNGVDRSRIVALPAVGGLAMPETFARLCEAVATEIATRVPARAQACRTRAAAITRQAAETGDLLRQRVARLQGRPVAAARHQEAFVTWLGLKVRTTLPVGDDLSPALVARALEESRAAGAVAVVGNLPSGRRFPAALSEALGVPLIMLENFPSANHPEAFWAMLDRNVDALLAAVPR